MCNAAISGPQLEAILRPMLPSGFGLAGAALLMGSAALNTFHPMCTARLDHSELETGTYRKKTK